MFASFSYPNICTDKYAETVAFYEDYLDYEVSFELQGFAVMRRTDWANIYLAIINSKHAAIPEHYRKTVAGMILSYPSHSVKDAYDTLYWEGITLVTKPAKADCGHNFFFVEDPNGILIEINEPLDIMDIMAHDSSKEMLYA